MTSIRPHAAAAAAAAEAVRCRAGFWDMRELLFQLRMALETPICSGTSPSCLDVAVFDRDRASIAVADRIRQDAASSVHLDADAVRRLSPM